MSQVHQWFVKQGRLGISSRDQWVSIEVDPEGAEQCLLTLQDATEVAGVIASHAKAVWERVGQTQPFKQSFEAVGESAYRWRTEGGDLSISRPVGAHEVSFHYVGQSPCRVTVGQAVELVQLLEHLVRGPGEPA